MYFEFPIIGENWCLRHIAAPVAPTKGAAGPAIAGKIYDQIPLTASEVVAAVIGSAMLWERSYMRNSSH
jgi:hypothetical protein